MLLRILWGMTLSLEQPFEGEERLLDKEGDHGLCEHPLLDQSEGGLRPSDGEPCQLCQRTWRNLLHECVQKTVDSYQQSYCCTTGDRPDHFLVHQVSTTCPHCSRPKSEHIACIVTALVGSILSVKALPPPGVDISKKIVFDPQLAVWGAFNCFPETSWFPSNCKSNVSLICKSNL